MTAYVASAAGGAVRERIPAQRVASALDLLAGSGESLTAAGEAAHLVQRYAAAQLAALRAAAAVLAIRGPRAAGSRGTGGPRNVWELLPVVAPELHEWASYFAICAARRTEVPGAVTGRDADDLVRSAAEFHDRCRALLGLARRREPERLAPAVPR